MKYDFAAIESKWQKMWEETKPYAAITGDPRPKFYGLIEFPYPSAAGLHVGHPRPFTAMDIICRKKRISLFHVKLQAACAGLLQQMPGMAIRMCAVAACLSYKGSQLRILQTHMDKSAL